MLKEGDIISVDCGVILNKYYGDSAYTFAIGEIEEPVKLLLRKTKESLFQGIQQAVEGKRVGDISYSIQSYCESFGYSVVREMVGHGLGHKTSRSSLKYQIMGKEAYGPVLKKGMVICIEPMINMGTKRIFQEKDGWTIRTHDNKPSAHFELALAIDKEKADVLSTFSYIENVLGNQGN